MKHFFILICIFIGTTSFQTRNQDLIDEITKSLLKDLKSCDSKGFQNKYSITNSDLKWYTNTVNSDSLIEPNKKNEYINELNSLKKSLQTKALKSEYEKIWLSNLNTYQINKDSITITDFFFMFGNQKLNLDCLVMEMKLFHKGSYYKIKLDLANFDNKWKVLFISEFEPCDKYYISDYRF
ncbi:hypothetical protein [Cytophaga aurantiaca]|uniref:hypothetical protein n=1 Tax=Cytophaga aurantiaca TaxID=29530 RepID=UPI0003762280|nr:hypothetical protein [Cytophaga aurantiaca]